MIQNILVQIREAVRNSDYNIAFRNAVNITHLGYYMESKTDVFLGEMLEGIYNDINYALITHDVSDDDKVVLNKGIVKDTNRLVDAYSVMDDAVPKILIDMRYATTVFKKGVDIKYDRYEPHGREYDES